jgi:beta-lactamase superfamily II metal-dependent hydrolase
VGRTAARLLPKAGLGLATVLVWSLYFSLPDDRLKVTVLDVGQGDAVLIQTPSGANVLVDGGPSGSALAQTLARELPLLMTRIDLLVVAAPRDENLGGLPDVLTRYNVGRAIITGAASCPASRWRRHVVRCDEYCPSRRNTAPSSPGVHRSASWRIPSLRSTVKRRRAGRATTSVSAPAGVDTEPFLKG